MNSLQTLEIIIGGMSLLFGVLLAAVYHFIRAALDLGKSYVVTLPEVPGALANVKRTRLRRGTFKLTVKDGQDKEIERWITSDTAGYPTRKGPLHIVGASTGWNLVAPSKRDVPRIFTGDGKPATDVTEEIYARMLVADPLIYERAVEENDFEDFLAAKQNKDPWQVRLLPLLAICLVVSLAVVGLLVWRLLPLLTHATSR